MKTVRFLQSQHAQYGYASYWNAGSTTVLSGHTVKVRQITIGDGLPRPHRLLSSDAWYEPINWQGPSFLFLSKEEDSRIDWAAMSKLSGEPRKRVVYNHMIYTEYDHNIARDLPLWSLSAAIPIHFPATANTAHSVGEYDAARGELHAPQGAAGLLRFGPYAVLAAGRYQVTFDLNAQGESVRDFGYADVIADGGVPVAKATIEHAGAQHLVLSFSLPQRTHNVEYRLISNGAGALGWHDVTVQNMSTQLKPEGAIHGQ